MDYRNEWKGWEELPDSLSEIEGNTVKYPNYQKIIQAIIKDLKPKTMVEIGFNAGHSACCMLDAAPDEVKFFSFDIGRHGYESNSYEILSKFYNLTLTLGESKKTLEPFLKKNNIKIDFAFVDGCHGGNKNDCCKSSKFNERCPYTDINTCKKYMNIGGIIFVDDMGIADVIYCFDNVNWEDYEDLTYLTESFPSEKKFKIMRKIK